MICVRQIAPFVCAACLSLTGLVFRSQICLVIVLSLQLRSLNIKWSTLVTLWFLYGKTNKQLNCYLLKIRNSMLPTLSMLLSVIKPLSLYMYMEPE